MLCAVQLVFNVLALAVMVWALVTTLRQLKLERSAAGGRAAVFTAGRTGTVARVRFEVGGSGVLNHVAVFLVGVDPDEDGDVPVLPEQRITMSAADERINWEFELPSVESAANAWVVVTWRLPHLEGVRSAAIARWLDDDDVYRVHLYPRWSMAVRRVVRNWARRHRRLSWKKLRELSIYGNWERRTPANPLDIHGAIGPPPRK